jgi:hypothetical protein
MQGNAGHNDVKAINSACILDCFALLAMTKWAVIARRSRSNPELRTLTKYVVI